MKDKEVKEQGQGQRCATCNHQQLYHTSYGPCLILNCKCQEWLPKEDK